MSMRVHRNGGVQKDQLTKLDVTVNLVWIREVRSDLQNLNENCESIALKELANDDRARTETVQG